MILAEFQAALADGPGVIGIMDRCISIGGSSVPVETRDPVRWQAARLGGVCIPAEASELPGEKNLFRRRGHVEPVAARIAGARMDQFGDGQPPAEDARPVLPTEIEFPYPSAQDARPFLPTEVEPPYPPAHAGPVYPPTHTGSGKPAAAGPSYTPGPARPAEAGRADPLPDFMKYGPGVPATRRPTLRKRLSVSGAPAARTNHPGARADGADWPARRSP